VTALRVAVIREEIEESASPDAQDTVLQARSVCESLEREGWECVQIMLGHNPQILEEKLLEIRPDVVFNLVESYLGVASLACVAPALCRKAGIPFTGADEGVMALAGDKAAARRLMRSASIPVPDGASLDELRQGKFPGAGQYIIKSRFEDASLGLDGDCVVEVRSRGELQWAMEELAPRMAGDCVAERYVAGREFNLALLADASTAGCRLCLWPKWSLIPACPVRQFCIMRPSGRRGALRTRLRCAASTWTTTRS
jgi:D-alanine-D-alanine ligase